MNGTLLLLLIFFICSFLAYAIDEDQSTSSKRKSANEVTVHSNDLRKRFLFLPFLLATALAAGGTAGIMHQVQERKNEENGKESRRQEQARETQLNRKCPGQCWGSWPSAWSTCSSKCGGGGIQWQHRSKKTGYSLGECRNWVSRNGCKGQSSRSRACNRFCRNGGTPGSTGCWCRTGYRGSCCETRITCHHPGTPSKGRVSPSGSGLHYGTVVRYHCNIGYRLTGSATRTCAGWGAWTNSVPTCNIIKCGKPGTPANAKLQLVSGSGYVYGSYSKVSCNRGYRLLGHGVRRCGANGKWSGTAPSCQLIECPTQPAPTNGAVAYPSGRNLDDKLVYSCNTGFVLQGSSNRLCQSSGKWTSESAICNQILCKNLPAPSNGRVAHSQSSRGKTHFGQKATFTCNQGYVLEGSASLTCGGDTVVGKFSGQPPTCAPVNCGHPGSPTNGVRSSSVFTLGQAVTFTCGPGHYLQGQEKITCLHTGKWSHPKPTCPACAANTYKPYMNNAKTCMACPANSGTGGLTSASAQTQCLCARGYKGSPGGPCTLIQCPALPAPANGRTVSCGTKLDEKCIFYCKEGHVVSRGNVQRTCTERETWTGTDLKCTACPKDTYKLSATQCEICPNNSHTTGTGNAMSGCACNSGFQGPGGGICVDINECTTNKGGCEQTCVNRPGDYTCECTNPGFVKDLDDFKKCVSKNKCRDMTKPANGGAVCYAQRKTNTERCYIKCNKGFEHVASPNAYEECGPSTNWKWSYEIKGQPIPDCVPAFFEGTEVDIEVFYFTGNCESITEEEKKKIAWDLVALLTKKGACKTSAMGTCSIDDVDIECGGSKSSSDRKKKAAKQEVIVRFKLKSKDKPLPQDKDCDSTCREEIKNKTEEMMKEQAKVVSDIFEQNNNTVTIGGIEMEPMKQVSVSEPEPSCETGRTIDNGICVVVSCNLPEPPVNGTQNVNGHLYSNVTTFNCLANHELVGDNTTVCLANGTWSSYDTSCIHFRDLFYDCKDKDPCNPRRLANRNYFKHVLRNKFIHCGAGNTCHEKTCPSPLLWSNKFMKCTWPWQLQQM